MLHDLKVFLPEIVLVGGWLPFVYAKYLWPEIYERPVTTADIDIAIRYVDSAKGDTIDQQLTKLDYPKQHLKFGKERPYVFLVKNEAEGVSIPLDFICAQEDLARILDTTGKDVLISDFAGFDVLYHEVQSVEMYGLQITIPSPERYVFYKLKTFIDREDSYKRWKDLYYVCFIHQTHPDCLSLVAKTQEPIRTHPWGNAIIQNIQKNFCDEYDTGPLELAKQVSACEISLYMERPLEKSVFDIIAAFLIRTGD